MGGFGVALDLLGGKCIFASEIEGKLVCSRVGDNQTLLLVSTMWVQWSITHCLVYD